ncbi:uncharacterized protein F4822DRAFT_442585 [Hypoxylon trugodes]|uniref:uncharacterized protein n=1 Tax=Hypoxylon trugodes TaxID=326681 RepID=UPI00218CE425|nr:uncharacterized protein F4822DRAFT_442585 [Hypoxylon trugodes]KAI1382526.1 hypothetical protein F4822DRAFT_442585 [Hypoxylon trugodes]
MARSSFTGVSQRVQTEKIKEHLGTASVSFNILNFPYSKVLDPKKVQRLTRLFKAEGCRPVEFANRIPALVHKTQLQECLSDLGLPEDQLLYDGLGNPSRLEFPHGFRLTCLRGRHRVKAAEDVLHPADRRWVVDLYPAEISEELKAMLIRGHSNEWRPNHGEFFYRIREFQGTFGERNDYLEHRWFAHLASVSTTFIAESFRQLIHHPTFGPAFDGFQHLPAVYDGLLLGIVKKMIAMKCHEEHISFLEHVRGFFESVFDRDVDKMQKFDVRTLKEIQYKAPGACKSEDEELYDRVCDGELFGAFTGQERDVIWRRVRSATADCVVPSLSVFFKARTWLEGPARCLRRLVKVTKEETIRSTIEQAFSCSKKPRGYRLTDGQWFDFVYRTLWLYAIRGYRDMLPEKPEKKKKLGHAKRSEADGNVLFEFASLANELGVYTKQIGDILGRESCHNNIEDRMLDNENTTHRGEEESLDRNATGRNSSSGPPTRRRLFRGSNRRQGTSLMFLAQLHSPIEGQGESPSSFFVERSSYFAYFGREIDISLEDLANLERDIIHDKRRPSNHLEGSQESRWSRKELSRASSLEECRSERLPNIRREILDQEVLLREQQRKIEDLRAAARDKEIEVAQIADEENRLRAMIEELRGENELRIRQGGLGAVRKRIGPSTKAEEDLRASVEELSKKEREQQARLEQLAVDELDWLARLDELQSSYEKKRSSLAELEAKERGKIENLEMITAKVRELTRKENELLLGRTELLAAVDQSALAAAPIRDSETAAPSNPPRDVPRNKAMPQPAEVVIKFMARRNNDWIISDEVAADPKDPLHIQRIAVKYLRKGIGIYDHNLQVLYPETCFNMVTSDGTNTIYLQLRREV